MKVVENIKKEILFMGLEKGEFLSIEEDIINHNRKMINVGTITLSLMLIAFMIFRGELFSPIAKNLMCINLIIFMVGSAFTFVKAIPTRIILFIWIGNLYALALSQDVIFFNNQRVAFSIVGLFFTVILFRGVFYRSFIFYAVGLIGVEFLSKASIHPHIHEIYRLDVIIFCITCAALSYCLSNQFASKAFAERKLMRIAMYDDMVDVKNRNAFDKFVNENQQCDKEAHCIYVDANNLRELNNIYGHEAGDKMLRTVAKILKNLFGSKEVYRIGGDEFVAFAYGEKSLVLGKVFMFEDEIAKSGYSAAIGFASGENPYNLKEMTKRAENLMYEDKNRYYEILVKKIQEDCKKMSKFELTPDLLTGNEMIDGEHRELIAIVNQLIESCGVGKGRGEVEAVARHLASYVKTHFAHEEKFMDEKKYPGANEHKEFHKTYAAQFMRICSEINFNEVTIKDLSRINTHIMLLVNHIKTEDKKMAQF